MRDVILIALVMGALPLCVVRPYFGILLWYILGYLNPHRFTWGFAQNFPFSEWVAGATFLGLVGLVLRGQTPRIPWTRETALIVLLWLMFFVTSLLAMDVEASWPAFAKVSKVLLMTLVTIALVDDYRKLRWMIWVVVLSIGFYGAKGGLFTVLSGGNYLVYGPPNSSIADNTALGLALNMILPIMFFMSRVVTRRWMRYGLLGMFFLSALAVFFTYSRGSMLGLSAVCALILLRLGFRWKVACAVVVILAAPVAITQIPDHWFDKMSTLKTYQDDGSAMGRIEAWKAAWNLALDRPLIGGGFNIINDVEVYRRYNPEVYKNNTPGVMPNGIHSTYLELIGENGFVTFGIFMTLMVFTLRSCRQLRIMGAKVGRPEMIEYGWMFQIGIIGYAISGAFLEFASFDLYYHLIALVIVAKSLLRKELIESRAAQPIGSAPRIGLPARPEIAAARAR